MNRRSLRFGLTALLSDRHLKGHELQSQMIPRPYHAYGNLRECIQMRCYICIAQAAVLFFFFLSALSSVFVEEVFICLSCVTKISLEEDWGETKDSDRHPSCLMFMVNEEGMEQELSTPQPPARHWKLTQFSLSLFLPPIVFLLCVVVRPY